MTGVNTPALIPKSTTLNTEFESSAESKDIVLPLRVKLFCACTTPSIETNKAPFADGVKFKLTKNNLDLSAS